MSKFNGDWSTDGDGLNEDYVAHFDPAEDKKELQKGYMACAAQVYRTLCEVNARRVARGARPQAIPNAKMLYDVAAHVGGSVEGALEHLHTLSGPGFRAAAIKRGARGPTQRYKKRKKKSGQGMTVVVMGGGGDTRRRRRRKAKSGGRRQASLMRAVKAAIRSGARRKR